MKTNILYRCNECYAHLKSNEGCHTDDVKSFVDNKVAPCLDKTWDKNITFPLFYEMPYSADNIPENI